MLSRQMVHHRRKSLATLRALAVAPLDVRDDGPRVGFAVHVAGAVLIRGRYEVVAAYLMGYSAALVAIEATRGQC